MVLCATNQNTKANKETIKRKTTINMEIAHVLKQQYTAAVCVCVCSVECTKNGKKKNEEALRWGECAGGSWHQDREKHDQLSFYLVLQVNGTTCSLVLCISFDIFFCGQFYQW